MPRRCKKQCDALRSGLIDMLHTQEEKSAQEEKDEQKRVTTAYHTFYGMQRQLFQ